MDILEALLIRLDTTDARGRPPDPTHGEKAHTERPAASSPRELAARPLPTYRIEPPDILQVEMLKQVPRSPYRVAIFDVLQIEVAGALPDYPISNYYLVQAEGTLNLGPAYGKVRVAGMTIAEVSKAIREHLQKTLRSPEISVELARSAGMQPVTGTYLVGPDGTVNLRQYGTVQVMGKTSDEAKAALQKQLSKYLDSPEVSVDVAGLNSQVYYVITEGAGLGDKVTRLPISGQETVLDALGQVGGLSQLSSKKIWIARPSPSNPEKGTTLPVDYEAITRRGATATNYQIMPGDRVFIAQDDLVTLSNSIAKMSAPAERVLGLIGLAASTIRQLLPPQGQR